MITLEAKKREGNNNEKLRSEGLIPAVFYGKKEKSTPISVNMNQFLKVWKEAGESSVITLEGEMGNKDALIKDVDIDPVNGNPRHADFYVFEKGHKVEVNVPLEFIGVAPAVKELGGTLVKVLHEISIEAEPKDLPHEIEVDISSLLNFESQILAKDIKLPQGVVLIERAEEVVALVEEMKEETDEAPTEVDLSSIEVEKKGKKEEEGAEGAAPEKAESQGQKE